MLPARGSAMSLDTVLNSSVYKIMQIPHETLLLGESRGPTTLNPKVLVLSCMGPRLELLGKKLADAGTVRIRILLLTSANPKP